MPDKANLQCCDGDQSAVIHFLSSPDSHGDDVQAVERIVTHAAIVFVAGNRAYKIKRAVKLPYLDFTSLSARHKFLLRELELNKPTAPKIYLDVHPIYLGAGGKLSFAPPGDVVDWCLVMRAFDQGQVLSNVAEANRFDEAWIPGLVRSILTFHEAAPVSKSVDQVGMLGNVIDQIATALAAQGSGFPGNDVARHIRRLRDELMKDRAMLSSRTQDGFVRRCHGDLHLGNIVALEGEAVPFDALEFDESLATIDVLYDLSFLLMDCWRYGLKSVANLTLNRYLSANMHLENLKGLSLLPLYLSLRASIRVMVALQRNHSSEASQNSCSQREAQSLFSLAQSMLTPKRPQLIAVGGLSGSGKTTISAHLAPGILPVPGAVHIRSDVERKRLFGVSPTTRLGPEGYATDVTDRVYGRLLEAAGAVLEADHSVVVDAVFSNPAEREAIEACAEERGVEFHGVWLQAEPEILMRRVEDRRNDASDATPDIVKEQSDYDIGAMTWHVVSAAGSLQENLNRVYKVLHGGPQAN